MKKESISRRKLFEQYRTLQQIFANHFFFIASLKKKFQILKTLDLLSLIPHLPSGPTASSIDHRLTSRILRLRPVFPIQFALVQV